MSSFVIRLFLIDWFDNVALTCISEVYSMIELVKQYHACKAS